MFKTSSPTRAGFLFFAFFACFRGIIYFRLMNRLILLLLTPGVFLVSLKGFAQCEPSFHSLVINEFMASNNSTAADEFGEYNDWVEIFNGSDQPIDLEGYFLSDNHGNRTKFVFPSIVLAPDEVVTIWCDSQPEQGSLHTAFGLSADGEEIGLYNPDTVSVDYVRFGSQPTDISTGRFPNGTGPFSYLIPTFNAENTNSINPGLVINEFQAINESTASDQWGGFDDWIELYNNSNQSIDLTGYFLSDKIGSPTLYQFPDTFIGPGEYLIVWCDQGLFEPGLHAFFGLGGDGDDILLSNADTLTLDYVRYGLQVADETSGRYPNGTGEFTCFQLPTWNESNGGTVGVSDREGPSSLKAWPNPATDLFFIETNSEIGSVIRVYNASGQLVESIQVQSETIAVSVIEYPRGFYIAVSEGGSTKFLVH